MNLPKTIPVLKDEKLQMQFERDGFVRFKFLDEKQINRLADFYTQVTKEHEAAIREECLYATSDTGNAALLTRVDNVIKEVMVEQVEKHFVNYQFLISNYLIKGNGENTEMAPHQDLLFVDEPDHTSFNIWVPLQDTGKNSGHIRILKGSHRLQYNLRISPTYPWPYQAIVNHISGLCTDVYTKLGDCVVINHAVIHGSAKNITGKPRVAAILTMASAPTDLYYYYMPPDGQNGVEKYLMKPEMYCQIGEGGKPGQGTFLEYVAPSFEPVTMERFETWRRQNMDMGILEKARNFFTKQLA